jgi:hypothetical protein
MVVLSPTYVSFFYEGAGTQPRVGALDRTTAVSNELQPGAVATFASPYLTVLKAFSMLQGGHADLWPLSDVAMVNIYAGALTPILALFALARRPGAAWRWWVVGLGALCLACAMGESLPLRGWLYDWFYPMRFFRHPPFSDCISFSARVCWQSLQPAILAMISSKHHLGFGHGCLRRPLW